MSDPLDDLILKVSEEEQKKDALRSSMTFGLLQNPDERAKAQQVAKQLGTTPQAAQENLSNFERAAKRQAFDFDKFIKHTPKLSTWAANPENAAIAHDDLEVLTGLETASQKAIIMARNAATVRNRMVGGGSELTSAAAHVNKGTLGQVSAFLSAAGGAADWTAYSVGQLLNVLTGPTTLDTAMKSITSIRPSEMDGLGAAFSRGVNDPMNRYFESGMKARAPLFVQLPDGSSTYNWKEIGAYWDLIAENAPQLAVQWGASMKAFNAAKVAGATDAAAAVEAAAVARPIEWGQTVGEEFENTRRKDVPMAQGLLTSAASATAQTIVSQGIPGRSGGLDALLFERLAKSSAGKKGVVGAAQRGILGAVKEGTEEATQEGVSILGQRTYDPTAFQGAGGRIATAAIGGALVGGPMASIAFRDNVREISDLAAQSKLKARDSEAFAGFMKEVGGEAFIDANRLTTFFQENGIDPVQGAEMVGARNYAEAMVAGTDAVVSVADLVSKLKPEQVNALADDLRVGQGEMSAREVEAYDAAVENVDLTKDAEPVEPGPKDQIREETYQKIVATGYAPRVAEVYAEIHADAMENLAKQFGVDPLELHRDRPILFMRILPDENVTDTLLSDRKGMPEQAPSEMSQFIDANPEMDPLLWQGDKLTERLAALRQRLTLESGASDGTDLQAQREPRTEGSPDAGGTPGLGGEVPAAAAGGATLRVASAQDANARIDWLSSPEGVDAQNKAPHVYEDMPDVTFKSWDGTEQTYTVSVQGRDVFLDAPVVDGKPRGGISLEVTPDGDLYVRIIHNGDLKGAGLFLYQEGIKAAMAQFPEVTRDSMVFGDTSDLAIAARQKVGGTDVFENPMGNKVSETSVRAFLDYQPDQLLSRLKALGIDPLKATDAEISAKLAENPQDQVFFQGPLKTDSPEFKAWFGGSKVVAEDGSPLVVYHGTTSEFETFSKKFQGAVTRATSSKNGFFFVDSARSAQSYADHGATVTPIERLIEEADKAGDRGDWDTYDSKVQEAENLEKQFQDPQGRMRGQNLIPVYLSIKNPLVVDAKGETPAGIGGIDPLIKKAKREGRDGVIIKNFDDAAGLSNDNANHYIVFEPNQIKSATGNAGTFDPNNPNILFQPGDGSRAAKMSARMRKLGMTTRASMDKSMSADFMADEAAFAAFEEQVKKLQAGDVMGGKRGVVQFGHDGRINIGILQDADLSTVIHELMGHAYLEIRADLSEQFPDSEGAKDHKLLLDFVGAKDTASLTVEQKETLARSVEAYFMEGKAPSEELRPTFQRIKYWMMQVYRALRDLGVQLNPEVRGVFDRMFAGEKAVAGAERYLELKPMFANAEDMAATQAEYEAYAKMAGKATMTAREAVEAKLMRELMREREAWWKEETAKVAEEVAAELQTAPGYVALRTLTQGEDGIKLSKQALLDAGMTQEELNALPRSKSRVYGLEGGMDLQAAAEVLGFPSGDELLTTLRELKPFRDRVKEITEARMKAEHGDMMTDGSLTDEAIEAVHNGHYADLRMAELRVLERMRRQAKPAVEAATRQIKAQAREAAAMPPIQSFRDTAVEIVERTAIRDLQPHRYLQARVKASQEASKAYTKLDFEAAAEAKRREILNHFLYLESSKAREESTKVAEYARRATDKKFLQRMGKAGGDYLNQWLNLAGRYDFTQKSKVAIEQGIQEWAKAREAEGIIIDPMLFNEGRTKNWREVPVVELRAIHDALVNIETVARRARMVLAGEKQVDFEVAVHDLTSQAYGNFKAKPLPLDEETQSLTEKALSHARKWNVDLLKFEEIVDRLDKGDINGPWRRYIFEPMALAQYREFELNRKMTLLLNEAMEEMPKKMRRNLTDEVTLDGIGTVTRKFLVSMALNTGNDSNQAKMLKGMGWADPAGMEKFGKALDKLTREEWVFIQKTWDALESLWPEIAALEKRMTGLEPTKVDRTPFTVRLADGSTLDMQGGYYPVSYDPKRSGQGAMQADADIMSPEGMFKGPVTFKGHTKERVENFAAPLLFDFEQVLSKHVPRVVKDLSHREAAMSVAKLLRDQEVRQSVQETIGPEYEAAMMPWLQGTVNDPAGASTELTSWLGKARSNLVVASLAFRASSVIVQVMDPMRSMVGEHAIKPQYLLGATAKLSADLAKMDLKTIREIRAMSGEMAGRAENLDRDLRSMWRRNLGKDGFYAQTQRAGMKGLAVADAMTSTVVWLGAYDQAIAEGSPKAEAVSKADRVVRLKLMTGAAKDLTRLQRSPDMASKLMTTYMGDAVSVYGMMSRSVHNVANGEKAAASAFAFLMAGMILPVLADMVKGKMPKDDEEKAAWALKKAAFGLPSSIPLVRDVVGSIESGYDYSFSPIASQIAKIPKFAKKYSGDKDVDEESLVLDLVELIGGFSGIPGTGQAMTTLRYMKAVDDGKKPEPETKAEKAKNAILGSPGKGK